MGVPGFASFWAELLVFVAAIGRFPLLGVLAVAGLVVSALFMLRVFKQAFFGPANPAWEHLQDIGPFMAVPRVILIAVLLIFGFFPSWVLDLVSVSTRSLLRVF